MLRSEARGLTRSDSVGGCIFVQFSTVSIEWIFVSGCRSLNGAGLGASSSMITVSDSIFSRNGITSSSATLVQGAGGYVEDGSLNVISCIFDKHFIGVSSGNINGGILAFFRSNATFTGISSVSGLVITKTEGGSIHGGIQPLVLQLLKSFNFRLILFFCLSDRVDDWPSLIQ